MVVNHNVTRTNISMGKNGSTGPGQQIVQIILVFPSAVFDVELVDMPAYLIIGTKACWQIFIIIKQHIFCAHWAIGETVLGFAHISMPCHLSPTANHGPGLPTQTLFAAIIRFIPYFVEGDARY